MAFATQMSRSAIVLPAHTSTRSTGLRATGLVPTRTARFVVRAEGPVDQGKKDIEKKLDNEVGPAARDAFETTTQRTVAETSPPAQDTTFGKVMAFSGYAPERVNSRLAMLGITAALGAELATGKGLFEQVQQAPVAIGAAFLLFIAASIIPTLRGVKPDQADNAVFNSRAELWNGRAAMLGFAALIATELVKGSALL